MNNYAEASMAYALTAQGATSRVKQIKARKRQPCKKHSYDKKVIDNPGGGISDVKWICSKCGRVL